MKIKFALCLVIVVLFFYIYLIKKNQNISWSESNNEEYFGISFNEKYETILTKVKNNHLPFEEKFKDHRLILNFNGSLVENKLVSSTIVFFENIKVSIIRVTMCVSEMEFQNLLQPFIDKYGKYELLEENNNATYTFRYRQPFSENYWLSIVIRKSDNFDFENNKRIEKELSDTTDTKDEFMRNLKMSLYTEQDELRKKTTYRERNSPYHLMITYEIENKNKLKKMDSGI